MDLHGQALLDYFEGDRDATIVLHRNDGFVYPPLPARDWFYEDGFPEIDRAGLELCKGTVLDVGAGSGSHSLALQNRGLDVVSLEPSSPAVEVMVRRGVRHPVRGSILDPIAGTFETVLLLGSIGVVENLDGLDNFFRHLKAFLAPGGRLITDSVDPRNNDDPVYVAYRRAKVAQGRYEGERTLRFEYKGRFSDWFEWMHVAFEPLAEHAARAEFTCEHIVSEGRRFLCQLEPLG